MSRLLIILICFLSTGSALAQSAGPSTVHTSLSDSVATSAPAKTPSRAMTQLESLEADAKRIAAQVDENQYAYEHQEWLTRAEKIVSASTNEDIEAFHPSFFGKMSIPEASTTIFYYLRYMGPRTSIDWIAHRTDKFAQTKVFTDIIPLQLHDVKKLVRPAVVHDMYGFEVADSITGKRLWWMPDVTIRLMFETLADTKGTPAEKEHVERVVFSRIRALFSYDDALTTDVSALPRLYSVTSKDQRLRVLTYMTVYGDLSSHCSGLVVRRIPNGSIDIYELKDETASVRSPERAKLKPDSWYGAVYYDMVEVNFDKTVYYTLLGYKSNDGLVKTRVIEPLWFDVRKCRFGAPIFEHEKATYVRRVFRYSSGANMMMRYDEKSKSIVFDHLSPNNSMFLGEFRYYGPDWSYDSYVKTNKYWEFKEDIELRNE